MKVQEQVGRDEMSSTEKGLSDLPLTDEQAINTSGGAANKPSGSSAGDDGPEESISFAYGR